MSIVHHGVLDEGVHFIQKPYSMQAIAEKVREVLDSVYTHSLYHLSNAHWFGSI
jgi:hypothetical protein